MKQTLILMLTLLALSSFAETLVGRVVHIADGDTLTVLDAKKTQHRIRLDRIDAPEKGQAFGQKAKQHLADLTFGREVKVEWKKTDQYQRILGIVYVDGRDVNLQMVRDGFAWHYKFFDQTPEYAEAERTARAAKSGLWADPHPIEPYSFRRAKRYSKKK